MYQYSLESLITWSSELCSFPIGTCNTSTNATILGLVKIYGPTQHLPHDLCRDHSLRPTIVSSSHLQLFEAS